MAGTLQSGLNTGQGWPHFRARVLIRGSPLHPYTIVATPISSQDLKRGTICTGFLLGSEGEWDAQTMHLHSAGNVPQCFQLKLLSRLLTNDDVFACRGGTTDYMHVSIIPEYMCQIWDVITCPCSQKEAVH